MIATNKIKTIVKKQPPVAIVVVTVLLTLIILTATELTRAYLYSGDLKAFQSSAKVLELRETIDKLARVNEQSQAAVFCRISYEGLLPLFNEAYEKSTNADSPEVLLQDIQDKALRSAPSPKFGSLLSVVPYVKDATLKSEQTKKALERITEISAVDARATYCLELEQALSRVYFLDSLKNPEAVSALFVGQLENFQVNVTQAREMLVGTTYPFDFESQHIALVRFLDEVAISLRADENDYQAFAATIEENLQVLDEILGSVEKQARYLSEHPAELALEASYLKAR